MLIRCERCQAEYKLTERQLRDSGTEVQCSICGHVFMAVRPGGRKTADGTRPITDGGEQKTVDIRGYRSRPKTHGALKIFVGLTVAATVAFAGIRWQQGRFHIGVRGPKASGGVPPVIDSRHPVANPPKEQPNPETEPTPSPVPGQAATPSPSTKGPVVEALPSPPPAESEEKTDETAPPPPATAHAESYEKLIAGADRLLENGSGGKAKDLYQKALRLRPGAANALAGLGFVALDRSQIAVAYEYFKRALVAKTSFPPAIFGMAEIHRARSEKSLALQSYQRYLQISPRGSDAAAARRQVQALKGGQ